VGAASAALSPILSLCRFAPGRGRSIDAPMLDRLYLPLLALAAIAAVAFAAIWPQGYGDRSPAPFGFEPVQRTPAMQAAMKREAQAQQRRGAQARGAVRDLQTQALTPQ